MLSLFVTLNKYLSQSRQKYSYVIVESEKALELWPENVKAAYRGAKAAVHLGYYNKGKRLAEQGLQLDSDNKPLQSLLNEAKEGLERNRKREV